MTRMRSFAQELVRDDTIRAVGFILTVRSGDKPRRSYCLWQSMPPAVSISHHTQLPPPLPRGPPMRTHRRRFLKTAAAGTAAVLGAPLVLTAQKTDTKLIVGEGEHKYEVNHEWPQLPDKFTWQTTHNVAVDKAGNLYVIHEG